MFQTSFNRIAYILGSRVPDFQNFLPSGPTMVAPQDILSNSIISDEILITYFFRENKPYFALKLTKTQRKSLVDSCLNPVILNLIGLHYLPYLILTSEKTVIQTNNTLGTAY